VSKGRIVEKSVMAMVANLVPEQGKSEKSVVKEVLQEESSGMKVSTGKPELSWQR
jgi:hypothetical protein